MANKKAIVLIAFFFVFSMSIIPCLAVSAATFEVTITGLELLPEEDWVAGFTFNLAVGDDFSFSNFAIGDAIPPALTVGWLPDPGTPMIIAAPSIQFTYGSADWDSLTGPTKNPLKSGTMFSFDYEGTVNGLGDPIQFSNYTSDNLFPDTVVLQRSDSNGANFAAVPIPPAILLLGSGLVGLVAIRRRRS